MHGSHQKSRAKGRQRIGCSSIEPNKSFQFGIRPEKGIGLHPCELSISHYRWAPRALAWVLETTEPVADGVARRHRTSRIAAIAAAIRPSPRRAKFLPKWPLPEKN
ncbi:hypothetical protein LPU83_pLPU83b_0055 (plasmid) [Rhizobium favelukesii]|uniref:Uncharacterized protein n=1 Tax=Rhizobium favelukesii TaxID=348824 RepID=W6RI58_9HYPH|nr:hypothetical protein LPU83_pLPU83b_0055 [Rhizobium favelukesii]